MFHVARFTWLLLDQGRLRSSDGGPLRDADALAALLAALCHDLEHPGTTNTLETATLSPLALLYNDASVLESHAASIGFELLLRHNMLAALPPQDVAPFRSMFLHAILQTDLAQHKRLVEDARARLRPCPPSPSSRQHAPPAPAPFYSPEDRRLAVAFVLHCADLHTGLLPPILSQRVACDLSSEFEAQAAAEAALGLKVTVRLGLIERALPPAKRLG